jgi:hypothetical protein
MGEGKSHIIMTAILLYQRMQQAEVEDGVEVTVLACNQTLAERDELDFAEIRG